MGLSMKVRNAFHTNLRYMFVCFYELWGSRRKWIWPKTTKMDRLLFKTGFLIPSKWLFHFYNSFFKSSSTDTHAGSHHTQRSWASEHTATLPTLIMIYLLGQNLSGTKNFTIVSLTKYYSIGIQILKEWSLSEKLPPGVWFPKKAWDQLNSISWGRNLSFLTRVSWLFCIISLYKTTSLTFTICG